jgi:beta-N-acetylhexosaminidase
MKRLLSLLLLLSASTSFAHKPDSLDLKIGQMVMMGIGERTFLSANDPLVGELHNGYIGGVVLFEKNLAKTSTKDSLKLLITRLQAYSPVPLFMSIDEEGGKVHRLKEKYGFFSLPSATQLGKIDNPDSTLFYNHKLAALLSDLGINLNYAPSVDMAVNPENTVIVKNERSFGAQPGLVAKHAALAIKAHHDYGIKTVIKHFPGHGSSTGDSHFGIVDVTNTWQIAELLPYDTLIRTGTVDAVMTAHIINRRWDTTMPATLSQPVVTGMLRGLLGYKGVVFSDDMQMQAIGDQYGFENAIRMAINAGVDVIMFANTLPSADKRVTPTQVHQVIKNLVLKGEVSRARIDESYKRITAFKQRK